MPIFDEAHDFGSDVFAEFNMITIDSMDSGNRLCLLLGQAYVTA